jgi:hypothetical protein
MTTKHTAASNDDDAANAATAKFKKFNPEMVEKKEPGGRVNDTYAAIIADVSDMPVGMSYEIPFTGERDAKRQNVKKFRAHVRAALKATRLKGALDHLKVEVGKGSDHLVIHYPDAEVK